MELFNVFSNSISSDCQNLIDQIAFQYDYMINKIEIGSPSQARLGWEQVRSGIRSINSKITDKSAFCKFNGRKYSVNELLSFLNTELSKFDSVIKGFGY